MEQEITFQCQENEIVLKVIFVDHKPDEVHVCEHLNATSWTVVGFNDLKTFINMAESIIEIHTDNN